MDQCGIHLYGIFLLHAGSGYLAQTLISACTEQFSYTGSTFCKVTLVSDTNNWVKTPHKWH